MAGRVPFPQLTSLVAELRQDTATRWAWRALRAATLEHRDRERPPGVAARFTAAGERYYGFKGRHRATARGLRSQPPRKTLYVASGALRAGLLRRTYRRLPKSQERVGFRLTLRGGAMNFLAGLRPVLGQTQTLGLSSSLIAAFPVRAHQRGGRPVSAYQAPARQVTRLAVTGASLTRAAESWADQFGWDARDLRWIGQRYRVNFLRILRSAAVSKKGRLKAAFVSRHLEQHDG
jgi:hypothetical protein